jgi:4-hydroxy-3-methylbut-2-enyl diphosphate reductase
MRILLANPRGYCAGVDRAIDIVELAIDLYGAPIYVRHEIVHNQYVVEELRRRGAIFVDAIADIPEGSTVVFSAHGVSPEIRRQAEERSLKTIDATCPLVTKVHLEAVRFAKQGLWLILVGHSGHTEVEGTMGEVPERTILVQTIEDAEKIEVPEPDRVAYLTQTTLSVDETIEILAVLKRRFPKIRGPAREDICYATQNRQNAVKELAQKCDLVLVVGSPTSSNSNRLAEVARDHGTEAYLIDSARDLEPAWLEGKSMIGVSSGASTPEVLVEGLVAKLKERGAVSVDQFTVTEEDLVFHLPSNLARELDESGQAREFLARYGRATRTTNQAVSENSS